MKYLGMISLAIGLYGIFIKSPAILIFLPFIIGVILIWFDRDDKNDF